MLKLSGNKIETAVAGTDYQYPITATNPLFLSSNILTINTSLFCLYNGTGCQAGTANFTNVPYKNNSEMITGEWKFNNNATVNNILKMNESLGIILLGVNRYLGGSTSSNVRINFSSSFDEWYIYPWSDADTVLNSGLHIGSSANAPIIFDDELVYGNGVNSSFPRGSYLGFGGNPSATARPIPPDFQIESIASGTANKQNITFKANRATGIGKARGIKEVAWGLQNADNPVFRIHMANLNNSFYIGSDSKIGLSTASPQTTLDVNGNLTIRGNFINMSALPTRVIGTDTDYLCVNITSGGLFRNETGC